MRTPRTNALLFLLLLPAGGCTLLVDAQLSDKPGETGGAGGVGGSGASSSSASSSSASSSSASSSSASSSSGKSSSGGQSSGGSSGGVTCPPNIANCDGSGCNVNLKSDPDHCGSCATQCMGDMPQCANGKCK